MVRWRLISFRLLPFIVVLLLTLLALRALIHNPFYTSHDGFLHLTRMSAYSDSLKDGQFPPRWATNLNGNMGSPMFVYIYPLPYALGAMTHFMGLSFVASFQFWMIVSTFVSALAMYLWLRQLYKVAPSLVGAIAYIWVPYRFLNIYVRAAYAEHLAFALPPLVFYCLEKLLTTKNRKVWWALFSIATAALLLMHTQIAAFTLPLLVAYMVVRSRSLGKKPLLLPFVTGLGAGILMASFVYLPDFFERHLVNFDNSFDFYQEYFVAPLQLLNSPWGYGFDLPGIIHDQMSFKIGQTQIAAAVVTMLVLIYNSHFIKRKIKDSEMALLFLLVWLAAVFLMTQTVAVEFVWQHLPLIKTIVDYPWRLFFLVVFSSSVLLAFIVSKVRFQWVVASIIIAFLLVSNRNHININLPLSPTDAEIRSYWGSGTAASNEYKPRIHSTDKIIERKSPVEITSGQGTLSEVKQTAQGVTFSLVATDAGILRINRFYFPETIILKNGEPLSSGKDYKVIVPKKESKTLDDTGLIEIPFNSPGGAYHLLFQETLLRKAANAISLGTFIIVCGILAYAVRVYLGRSKK